MSFKNLIGGNDKGPAAYSIISPINSGFLNKKGMIIVNWRKHWCVLYGQFIYFYKTKMDKEPVGNIELGLSSSIKRSEKLQFTFEIQDQSKKTHIFQSDNEEELVKWIECIEKIISPHLKRNPPKKQIQKANDKSPKKPTNPKDFDNHKNTNNNTNDGKNNTNDKINISIDRNNDNQSSTSPKQSDLNSLPLPNFIGESTKNTSPTLSHLQSNPHPSTNQLQEQNKEMNDLENLTPISLLTSSSPSKQSNPPISTTTHQNEDSSFLSKDPFSTQNFHSLSLSDDPSSNPTLTSTSGSSTPLSLSNDDTFAHYNDSSSHPPLAYHFNENTKHPSLVYHFNENSSFFNDNSPSQSSQSSQPSQPSHSSQPSQSTSSSQQTPFTSFHSNDLPSSSLPENQKAILNFNLYNNKGNEKVSDLSDLDKTNKTINNNKNNQINKNEINKRNSEENRKLTSNENNTTTPGNNKTKNTLINLEINESQLKDTTESISPPSRSIPIKRDSKSLRENKISKRILGFLCDCKFCNQKISNILSSLKLTDDIVFDSKRGSLILSSLSNFKQIQKSFLIAGYIIE
eukprot:TRINITY_DN2503_c0_g1_i4.p1 TRINITY_DN2503_c0_g1~~TRINITY_DN2503_c0_g1_i4.p1  ORF type:complete len:571 (-),score=212.33 TRINITY_DN2503_c0_g1_i4:80-1792(-)